MSPSLRPIASPRCTPRAAAAIWLSERTRPVGSTAITPSGMTARVAASRAAVSRSEARERVRRSEAVEKEVPLTALYKKSDFR